MRNPEPASSSRRSQIMKLDTLPDEEMTYFGTRKKLKDVKISSNVYDTIKSFNLGNLSELPTIPKYYQTFLLSFIIHISSAFSHVHKYDLIHGKFDLSKVVAQRNRSEYPR